MDAILAEINQFNTAAQESKGNKKRKTDEIPKKSSALGDNKPVRNQCLPDDSALARKWSFTTDYNDHFETPQTAYLDIYNLIKGVADKLNKPVNEVIIYDPYYCDGAMKSIMKSMGFLNVINENRDFYEDIRRGQVPGMLQCTDHSLPAGDCHYFHMLYWLLREFVCRLRHYGDQSSVLGRPQGATAVLPEQ
jgi:hypothetical protein